MTSVGGDAIDDAGTAEPRCLTENESEAHGQQCPCEQEDHRSNTLRCTGSRMTRLAHHQQPPIASSPIATSACPVGV